MLRSLSPVQEVAMPAARAHGVDTGSAEGGVTAFLPKPLRAITAAYAAGDAPLGERLLLAALDDGLPWDAVCAAAARGISTRHTETASGA